MLRFGWETFKKRPWFFIGVNVLLMVVSGISSQITATPGWNFTNVTLSLADFLVVQVFVFMGTTSFFLKVHDDAEGATLGDAWAPQKYWEFLGAYLLTLVIIAVGFVLLIIPGIILLMVLYFTPFLVIDRRLGPLQAIAESARITKGYRWQLFIFTLALALINILGFLAVFVGLLVSIPVSWLAMAHAYRILEHKASEVAPAAA